MDYSTTGLLDFIETLDGKFIRGVADFISTKHVYIYNFNDVENLDLLLITLLWRMENPSTRFSIYMLTRFPSLPLPRVVLIHKADIKNTNIQFIPTPKPKQRNLTIKELH